MRVIIDCIIVQNYCLFNIAVIKVHIFVYEMQNQYISGYCCTLF